MKSIIRQRRSRVAVGVAAIFSIAAGIAYAAIPDAAGVIYGCYRTSTDDQKGQLRVVEDPANCRSNESAIQWNQTGPAGPAGPAGADGRDGVDGMDGADGSSPTVTQLAAGDANCPAGGAAITDGAGATAYVCSGRDGTDGTPFSGTFTSPNGQYSISVTDTGVTVASPDSSIRVGATDIEIETLGSDDIEVRSSSDLDFLSGASVELRGGTTVRVESGSNASVLAAGSLSLRGNGVNIGGGPCSPAARIGDLVTHPPEGVPGSIFTGSTTVCVG